MLLPLMAAAVCSNPSYGPSAQRVRPCGSFPGPGSGGYPCGLPRLHSTTDFFAPSGNAALLGTAEEVRITNAALLGYVVLAIFIDRPAYPQMLES